VPYDGDFTSLQSLMARLDDGSVAGFQVRTPDLDDVFLALTGHAVQPNRSIEAAEVVR
jgi:ABC-2 type transport system ATP-binding protein